MEIILHGDIRSNKDGFYLQAENIFTGKVQILCPGSDSIEKIRKELKLAGFIETHRQYVLFIKRGPK
jgi:hypothetical protein